MRRCVSSTDQLGEPDRDCSASTPLQRTVPLLQSTFVTVFERAARKPPSQTSAEIPGVAIRPAVADWIWPASNSGASRPSTRLN